MDYLFYGFMWAFFWEWFTLQQGKPNDDIGRLIASLFMASIYGIIYNRIY